MLKNYDAAFANVIKSEGGYVNDPKDPGGMTNLGCTAVVWAAFKGKPVSEVTEAEMKALTPADVKPVYKKNYWDKVSGDNLPDGVDYCCFDCAINSGPGRAVKFLQEIVGVNPDGGIGPQTLAAVKNFDPKDLVAKYSAKRQAFLEGLDTFSHFGKGWTSRINSVAQIAAGMIGGGSPTNIA
jgi:lysozyme family protein